MSVDLTKLSLDTNYNAFKNNAFYSGSVTISGTTVAGANTRTFSVGLNAVPDMVDIVFGQSGTWFKQGLIVVPTNNAGGGDPSQWEVYSSIVGATLTITAVYVQEFITSEILTSTSFSYRMVDYSVF